VAAIRNIYTQLETLIHPKWSAIM